ncbi:MAG: dihydrodipicolinate synthase family protein, partial [Pseudomonadota bacterium]
MIGRLAGRIDYRADDHVLIDVRGVGYLVYCSDRTMQALPRAGEHVALYKACVVDGDFAKGRRIMSALLPLMRVLEQGGKFVATIKYGVTMQGIDCTDVRAPLKPLNKDDKRALEQVVAVVKRTVAAIETES